MDCVAVDGDGDSFEGRGLAEALDQNEDCGRLRIEKSGFVADDDVVEEDVDVGNLEGVEGCDECRGQRCLISALSQHLQDTPDLHDFGHANACWGSSSFIWLLSLLRWTIGATELHTAEEPRSLLMDRNHALCRWRISLLISTLTSSGVGLESGTV